MLFQLLFMTVKLYNSLHRKKEDFTPQNPKEITMYTCGPTVYDYAHIGNFRAYLFSDLLYRYLSFRLQLPVKWVMNITDVDDKTIRDSKGEGDAMANLKAHTDKFTKAFMEDLEKASISAPSFHAICHATDHVEDMQELVRKIYDNGFAYVRDGSVYFDLQKYAESGGYGELMNVDFEHFKEGVRIDKDEYDREQVSDFVLWKGKKEGEPVWEFELDGQDVSGRPGWHIECSAMEKQYFELPFDIHTGGVDLKFPHHEDEIAQSKAGYGAEPTRFWLHNEYLLVDNKKMSKSLGNFYTLRDLEEQGKDLMDYRYAIMSVHYRSKVNFTFDALEAGTQARKKLVNLYQMLLKSLSNEQNGDVDVTALIEEKWNAFLAAMDDDLNTPQALAAIFELAGEVHSQFDALNMASLERMREILDNLDQIFGLFHTQEKGGVEIPDEILELVKQRDEAKANKDYDEADRLREAVKAKGFDVRDGKDGADIFPL